MKELIYVSVKLLQNISKHEKSLVLVKLSSHPPSLNTVVLNETC